MGNNIMIEAFHGTDSQFAERILRSGFQCRPNKEHWLGNGIYFFIDYSLAKWWTTNPTKKFGVNIKNAAIIKCNINADSKDILDLRKLKDFKLFAEIYRNEFLPFLFHGELEATDKEKIDTTRLRCTYCDYLNIYYHYKLIIGTFYIPTQPYMPAEYGKFFDKFSISYIENQICIFDQSVITRRELVSG